MYKIEMLDMRKVRNWILLSLTLLLSCNRDAVYTVSIQGELEGVKYGTAYLRTFGEKDSFLLSSAIEKGRAAPQWRSGSVHWVCGCTARRIPLPLWRWQVSL